MTRYTLTPEFGKGKDQFCVRSRRTGSYLSVVTQATKNKTTFNGQGPAKLMLRDLFASYVGSDHKLAEEISIMNIDLDILDVWVDMKIEYQKIDQLKASDPSINWREQKKNVWEVGYKRWLGKWEFVKIGPILEGKCPEPTTI